MPTGYTADVCDGKVSDFKTFAMRCARAFGALIEMRDDSLDAKIPEEFKPSTYHTEQLVKDRAALQLTRSMSDADALIAATQAYKDALEARQKHVQEVEAVRGRLLSMRSLVADWQPPTSDHQGLKDFMIEQLDSTMKWDGKVYGEPPIKVSGASWKATRIECLERSIDYHTKEHEKEVQRASERTKWVNDLRRSLD